MATVGISEEQVRQTDLEVEVNHTDISSWFTYSRTNETHAAAKIITDEKNGEILGAHLLSDVADELINYFAMAIQLNLTTDQFKHITFAYPTAASDIGSLV